MKKKTKKVQPVKQPTKLPDTEPHRVADYLFKLPLSGLTPTERSDLWNACGMFIGRCKEKADAKAKT